MKDRALERDYDDDGGADGEDLERKDGVSRRLRPREKEVKSSEETYAKNTALTDV